MKPQMQTIRHDPDNGDWGDCFRACLASLLEIDAADVPHFMDGGFDPLHTFSNVQDWLAPMGWGMASIVVDCDLQEALDFNCAIRFKAHFMVTGMGPTGCDHTVLATEGAIVHDPSPRSAGLVGPCTQDGMYHLAMLVKL